MAVTLEDLKGRVGDVDAHEQIPFPQYGEVFGERGQRFFESQMALWERMARAFPESRMMQKIEDNLEITGENVWTFEGKRASWAADIDHRPAVMDAMGIQRQLIFPTMGLFAMAAAHGGGFNGLPKSTPEEVAAGKDALDAYNEWAGQNTRKYPDHLRIAGVLETTDAGLTPEALIKRTEALIATGVKAVMIPTGEPPAGVSPAHPALDDFYALLTQTNTALTFHPPSGAGFRKSDVWGVYPGSEGDVSFTVALHQAEENFATVLIMGGVLERHPKLRVGVIENGASWLGPMAERMDKALGQQQRYLKRLSKKPSEYMAAQIRASVLLEEPVEIWLERYPAIQECYCYSSDFPHTEGGEYSMKGFYDRIKPLGDDVLEKFFVTNPHLLLQ